MALVEKLRYVHIILNDDGSLKACRGEYEEVDTATGRATPKGTKRLSAAHMASVLPQSASLLATIDLLTAERDAALAANS